MDSVVSLSFFLLLLFIIIILPLVTAVSDATTTASASAAAFNLSTITFKQGFSTLFSDFNILRSPDDRSVSLLLNRYSGSGFISSDYYNYGLFSASIKLPANYSAGIVVALYTSNVDAFEKTHDELDIEFLGNVRGKPWKFQTNMYGNGSTNRGREERYSLWFDPALDFHRYTILWTSKIIIFYVDEIPIREIVRNEEMGLDYPSKPMSLYSTIWDGSTWATQGGRYHVNYRYQPFTAEFKDLVLLGCPVNPSIVSVTTSTSGNCSDTIADLDANPLTVITAEGRKSMSWFRRKFMYYSYCYDTVRYPIPPPECVVVMEEQNLFKETGRLKNIRFVQHRNHRMRRRSSRGKRRESIRRRKEIPLLAVEMKENPSPPEAVETKENPSPPAAVERKEAPSPAVVEMKETPSPAVEPKETPPPPPPLRRRFPAPPEATASGFL